MGLQSSVTPINVPMVSTTRSTGMAYEQDETVHTVETEETLGIRRPTKVVESTHVTGEHTVLLFGVVGVLLGVLLGVVSDVTS